MRSRRHGWFALLAISQIASGPASEAPRKPETAAARLPATHVKVDLTQVFVTVVDRDGNPVTDLRREDFRLTEDGKPVEIAVFEPPDALLDRADAPATSPLPGPPASPAATVPEPPQAGRRYVAVFDGYNNPSGLRFRAAKAATARFVEQGFRPGDQMSVIELRPQMRILADMTGSPERLRRAIDEAAFLPGSGSGLNNLISDTVESTAFKDGDVATSRLENLARFDRILEASGQRAFYENLTAIGDALAQYPGRKYLLLYSGGFPFLSATEQIKAQNDPYPAAFRQMLTTLARSNTAIYTMNIGDETFGGDVETAGNIRLSLARVGMDENMLENLGLAGGYLGEDPFYTKQTLAVLAGETGGRFVTLPDYDAALKSIDRELRAAYTLGYYTGNPAEDGRYRRISVKVARPGMTVQHRTGYFAPRPYASMGPEERAAQLTDAVQGRIEREELPLAVSSGFLPGDGGDTLTTLVVEVPLRYLRERSGSGGTQYVLDLAVVAKDRSALVVDSVSKTVQATLDPSHPPPPDGGLRLLESVTLPAGAAEVRLVLRDSEGGALTTRSLPLEVPDFGRRAVAVTSLHLMSEPGGFALVDQDFVPAAARQRLARAARTRREGDAIPPPPPATNPFRFHDGSVFQPTCEREIRSGTMLFVFFQALNLTYSEASSGPRVSVTFELRERETGATRPPGKQEAVAMDGGRAQPLSLVYRLDLGDLPPGDYDLRVRVVDRISETSAERSEPIRIVPAGVATTSSARP